MPLLNEERIKELLQKIPARPLDEPLLKLSCGEFIKRLDDKFAMAFFVPDAEVFEAFGKYRQFMQELRDVTDYIKRYEVEQSADEKAAAGGVDFPTLPERILLDCVRFYNLHSTEDAERLPICDWLLVLKSEGSAAQFQRNLSKIQSRNTNGRK